MNFTPEQLKDFARYVRVQQSGRYNMLSPNATAATGLSRDRYLFVLEHYDQLEAAAAATGAKA